MSDIEIARSVKLDKITDVAKNLNISEEELELYGWYKAKIEDNVYDRLKDNKNGKLILVTAINPTPLGEGKTTMSIAIADGLRQIGKKSILALREPSLGPVFGIKGGATGGGYSQVAPMEDINLHFTGDMHAITSANNLLSAMIDNHIFQGNELGIETVIHKRCVDLNDRQLRKVEVGLSGEKRMVPREDGFDITVASEVMAILCLAKDAEDLERRLGNIIIGFNKNNEPIYARDLKAEGSMAVLLKDAIKPNLVQTLEHTPAIIHGGPFANIAHGCNSIRATRLALKLADYTVTEAGFGADLGAEKFLDIKCDRMNIHPDAVVLVATLKALKYHGGLPKDRVFEESIECLERGLDNLYHHYNNLKNNYGLNVIVAINRYENDSTNEIKYLEDALKKRDIPLSLVEGWAKGGKGAIDIANKLVAITENKVNFRRAYDNNMSIKEKIESVAKKVYGARCVKYAEDANKHIAMIENLAKGMPICIAKTQYSLSDDEKNLLCAEEFDITVRDVYIKNGAGFVVVITGKIMTMPGLPKIPAAENIKILKDGNITGIF